MFSFESVTTDRNLTLSSDCTEKGKLVEEYPRVMMHKNTIKVVETVDIRLTCLFISTWVSESNYECNFRIKYNKWIRVCYRLQ